jgi:sulfoxide reductase heme-binding subunit YedZ
MKSGTVLKIIVHAGACLPLAWTILDYFTDHLTFNPIQAAMQRSGQAAIVLLFLTLACTPVSTFFRFTGVTSIRRTLGLYTFFYAALHFSIYIGLDYRFNWKLLFQSLAEKPFIIAGLTAFLILLTLAMTSYKYWMKIMGKGWKKLHRLVYLAGFIVILHYAWAKKGNLFTLQGDELLPLIALILYVGLMIVRLPVFRRFVTAWRHANLMISPHARKG